MIRASSATKVCLQMLVFGGFRAFCYRPPLVFSAGDIFWGNILYIYIYLSLSLVKWAGYPSEGKFPCEEHLSGKNRIPFPEPGAVFKWNEQFQRKGLSLLQENVFKTFSRKGE